jgi:hypothetical protein
MMRMTVAGVAAAAWLQTFTPDPFQVRTELQSLYDESSQALLQFDTEKDVDQFHDVLCTPDWTFVDAAGVRHTWADARAEEIRALGAPRADSIVQMIDKLTIDGDGASTTVRRTTVRTIVDADGRYGRKGASRTITETTTFRDAWVRSADVWRQKSRAQTGPPKIVVG